MLIIIPSLTIVQYQQIQLMIEIGESGCVYFTVAWITILTSYIGIIGNRVVKLLNLKTPNNN